MTPEELKSLLLVGTETRNLDFKEKFNWFMRTQLQIANAGLQWSPKLPSERSEWRGINEDRTRWTCRIMLSKGYPRGHSAWSLANRVTQLSSDLFVCQTLGDEGDQLLLSQSKIRSGGRALDRGLFDYMSNEAE